MKVGLSGRFVCFCTPPSKSKLRAEPNITVSEYVHRVSAAANGRVTGLISSWRCGELGRAHLEYLHEPGDVELGIQCKVVHVCDKGGNLFLEKNELVFERVDRQGIVLVVGIVFVVRTGVLRQPTIALLCLWVGRSSIAVPTARLRVVVTICILGGCDEALDGLFGLVYAPRELVGLQGAR